MIIPTSKKLTRQERVSRDLLYAVTNDNMDFRGHIPFREIERALGRNGFGIKDKRQARAAVRKSKASKNS